MVSLPVSGQRKMMLEDADKSYWDYLREYVDRLKEWVKPNPADHVLLQAGKLVLKSIALLILIALSPVILAILLFVFFAAF